MSSSSGHSLILGRIEFHLDLNQDNGKSIEHSAHLDTNGERYSCKDQENVENTFQCHNKYYTTRLLGFILKPIASESSQQKSIDHTPFQLVIPQSLLAFVCDAARFSLLVQVDRYGIFNGHSSQNDTHTHQRLKILELHTGGIHPFNPDVLRAHISTLPTGPFPSLSQLAAIERSTPNKQDGVSWAMANTVQDDKSTDAKIVAMSIAMPTSKQLKEKYFNFTACVDAVSPIITAHLIDPFALIEVYDKDTISSSSSSSAPLSAVVVLKGGDALSCHAAILPGSTLYLNHVTRKRWHVPSSLVQAKNRRLVHRTPSHVFVVTDAKCIMWDSSYYRTSQSISLQETFPSTSFPLVTIQGPILNLSWCCPDFQQPTLSCSYDGVVKYVILGTKPMQSKLYLMHYPIPPEVLCGLRKGAIVRAVNIHRIHIPYSHNHVSCRTYAYFGACLRSTMTLVQTTTERLDSESVSSPRTDSLNYQGHPYYLFKSKIHVDFQYQVWFESVRDNWYLRHMKKSSEGNLLDSPTENHLIILLKSFITEYESEINDLSLRLRRTQERHAYAEFFDHAVDSKCGHSELRPETGCIFSKSMYLPAIHGLMDIRRVCFDACKQSLTKALERDDQSWSEIGKRRRIEWNPCRLKLLLYNDDEQSHGDVMDHPVLVGGMVAELDSHCFSQPLSLKDSHCQLVCVPKVQLEEKSDKFSCNIHDLVIVRISSIETYCVSLGGIPHGFQPELIKKTICDIGSLSDDDLNKADIKVGSSSFLIVHNILFLVSMQVVYDKLLCHSRKRGVTMTTCHNCLDHLIITATTRKIDCSSPSNKDEATQRQFIIGSFERLSGKKSRKLIVSPSCVSGRRSKKEITITAEFSRDFINIFKSFAERSLDHLILRNVLYSNEEITLFASGCWILSESGRTAPLLRSRDFEQRPRIPCNEIILVFPDQSLFGTLPVNCILGDLSIRLVPINFRTIAEIIDFALKLPTQYSPMIRLTNAHVLLISSCTVQVKCSRCYKPLDQAIQRDGQSRCQPDCGSQDFSIIWECTCIIDDGTGQAILCADREACLSILGKNFNISMIEEYVWQDPFIFNVKSPCSEYLSDAINEAQSSMKTGKKRKLENENILDILPNRARAEYEFQMYCRYSRFPLRKRDFLCRCKSLKFRPLETGKCEAVSMVYMDGNHINRVELLTLPRLLLNLVDCDEDNKGLWDDIRAIIN